MSSCNAGRSSSTITHWLGRSPEGRRAYPSARSSTTPDSCSGPTASKRGGRSMSWTTDPGGGGGKASRVHNLSTLSPSLLNLCPLEKGTRKADISFACNWPAIAKTTSIPSFPTPQHFPAKSACSDHALITLTTPMRDQSAKGHHKHFPAKPISKSRDVFSQSISDM